MAAAPARRVVIRKARPAKAQPLLDSADIDDMLDAFGLDDVDQDEVRRVDLDVEEQYGFIEPPAFSGIVRRAEAAHEEDDDEIEELGDDDIEEITDDEATG